MALIWAHYLTPNNINFFDKYVSSLFIKFNGESWLVKNTPTSPKLTNN